MILLVHQPHDHFVAKRREFQVKSHPSDFFRVLKSEARQLTGKEVEQIQTSLHEKIYFTFSVDWAKHSD